MGGVSTFNTSYDADAAAMQAAAEVPVLTIGGLTYRGVILSIEEWLPFAERADALAKATDPRVLLVFYRDFLRAVFPKRRYSFWAPNPVKLVLGRPLPEVNRLVSHFFALELRAQVIRAEGNPSASDHLNPAPGSTSSGRTPAPAAPHA